MILALAAAGIAAITAIFSKIGGASGGIGAGGGGGTTANYEPNVTSYPSMSGPGREPAQVEFFMYGDHLRL